MNFKIIDKGEMKIIGITTRTNNQDELKGKGKIESLWEYYITQQFHIKIPYKKNNITLGLYTDYQSDQFGEYSFIIGSEVNQTTNIPNEMITKTIPAARYAVFTSSKGELSKVILQTWEKIWGTDFSKHGLNRSYTGDFELYDKRCLDPDEAIIDIYISVLEERS